ncbi:acyltransferase domain-containing protein [Nocardia sp. NPDC127579]|uniref:acyltransferase domain-containing protein n=1 Tax=Nocardia sp. NPDC127579 TaxID=3345402 RepID=UPI00362B4491
MSNIAIADIGSRLTGGLDAPAIDARHHGVLPLSARSPGALRALASRFADLIGDGADPGLLAAAAWAGTPHHPYRHGVLLGEARDLIRELRRYAAGEGPDATRVIDFRVTAPVFVFSGVGAQWWGMARELLSAQGAFAATARAVDAGFRAAAGWSVLDELMMRSAVDPRAGSAEIAEAATVLVQLALVAELAEFGIRPAAAFGQGVGEIAAAAATGVLSVADAVLVACHRARPTSPENRGALAVLTPGPPRVPLYSTVTAAPVTAVHAGADYWHAGLTEAPRCADTVTALAEAGHRVFLEIGPHPVLSTTIREILSVAGEPGVAVPTLDRTRSDGESLRAALAGLYAAGALELATLFPAEHPSSFRSP